jgi:predicted DNA-binding ribbon-helix-helix protein
VGQAVSLESQRWNSLAAIARKRGYHLALVAMIASAD